MTNFRKKKIIEAEERLQNITGLPTSFGIQTNEGVLFYDEKKDGFVKKNKSRWMADNPSSWMADNPSVHLEEESKVIGVVATPFQAEVYSQDFKGGQMIENRERYFGKNQESYSLSSRFTELPEEPEEVFHSQTRERRSNSYSFPESSSSSQQPNFRQSSEPTSSSRVSKFSRRNESRSRRNNQETQKELFTQHQLVPYKKH